MEHAFGILKGRFRRLGYLETKSVEKANKIVGAACVLHNMCDEGDIEADNADYVDDIEPIADAGVAYIDGGAGVRKRFHIVQELWDLILQ